MQFFLFLGIYSSETEMLKKYIAVMFKKIKKTGKFINVEQPN